MNTLLKKRWLRMVGMLAALTTSTASHADKIYFVHNDHLGTPQVITDENKNVVWEVDRDPWGNITNVLVNNLPNNVSLPGQYDDAETSYSDNWHRVYDKQLGQYFQADRLDVLSRPYDPELWVAQGMNVIRFPQRGAFNHLYLYSNQNPVGNIDPYGLYELGPGVPSPSGDVHKMLLCIDTCTGGEVLVTATTNGHSSGAHSESKAADFIPPGGASGSDKGTCCALKCHAVYVQDEYKYPSKHSTGGHIHAQTRPGAGGATGTGSKPKPECCDK